MFLPEQVESTNAVLTPMPQLTQTTLRRAQAAFDAHAHDQVHPDPLDGLHPGDLVKGYSLFTSPPIPTESSPLVRTGQGEFARDLTPCPSAIRSAQIYGLLIAIALMLIVGAFSLPAAIGIAVGLALGWALLTP